jgi:hypothetical protein
MGVIKDWLGFWQVGRLERLDGWKVGRLEGWTVGRLEGWKVGRLEGWKVGRFQRSLVLTCTRLTPAVYLCPATCCSLSTDVAIFAIDFYFQPRRL